MFRPASAAITAIALATGLAACTTTSPDVVHRYDAQRMAVVHDAVVLSTRPVVVDGSQTGLGAAAGTMVGAVAGSTAHGPQTAAVASVVGAVFGGLLGNSIERSATTEQAVELLVQFRSGERRAIVQARGQETLLPGDSVLVVDNGGRARVTRAPVPHVAPSQMPMHVPMPTPVDPRGPASSAGGPNS